MAKVREMSTSPMPIRAWSTLLLPYMSVCVCVYQLMGHLPARAEGSSWQLLYSSGVHGYSLRTLYRQMIGIDSPIVLVIMDTQHNVSSVKKSIALNGTPSQSYRVSLAIWNRTVLPATRHLTPAGQAGTQFTYPGGMEG